MLVKISIENYKSFDGREEISMVSSSKIRLKPDHRVKIQQTNLLKHAAVYGANASGKSNLVTAIAFIKNVLRDGLSVGSINDFCRTREENRSRESVFELQFTVDDTFYAYGFSAILSQRLITEEWLYELMQDGSARNLFVRMKEGVPQLGDGLKLAKAEEKKRFAVYSEDFKGPGFQLFLTEMNRGKKFDPDSKLLVFQRVFRWIMDNMIILTPETGLSNTNTFFNSSSLAQVSQLIQSFDTGIQEVQAKALSIEELENLIPFEIRSDFFELLKKQQASVDDVDALLALRTSDGFVNIKMRKNVEPEIITLVLKHSRSVFDFTFAEESDGTKRLIDLVEMLITKSDDIVFIVDELNRSLHPKLTERFLELFMNMHALSKVQLVFTTHEDVIMDQDLFRRDEIWFIERSADSSSHIYSLDRFKERYDKKLSKAYLEGRYGAIPVFSQFSFKEN